MFVYRTEMKQYATTSFFVRDPNRGNKPIFVGEIGDDISRGDPPEAAAWSKDGTVIAVRAAWEKGWTHAYDFKNGDGELSNLNPISARDSKIQQLLKSRGGVGINVLTNWKLFQKMSRPVAQSDGLP